MLYPNVSKPLYEQLKQVIRDAIRSGLYRPDEAIPGERQLMEIHRVSRMTVRQAIGDLVNEGILYRRHGSGTFVSPRQPEWPLVKLYGLVEELKFAGHEPTVTLIDTYDQEPSAEAKRELQLGEEVRVFVYLRLISVGGKPILLTRSHISHDTRGLFENLNINIAKEVIYEQLETCGYQISHAVQSVTAALPTTEEAKFLECDTTEPVLVLRRTTYLSGGYPVIYTRALYTRDYAYTIRLSR